MTTITSSAASIYSTSTNNTTTSVAKTSDSSLSKTAVTLASDASVIATLGGAAGSTPVYDAAGMLNELVQAGSSATSSSSTDSSTATTTDSTTTSSTGTQSSQESLDQAIVGSLSSSPSTSGIYTAGGSLQTSSSTDLTSNWATLLQTNPQLATTAIADSFDQGIVGTLSTSA